MASGHPARRGGELGVEVDVDRAWQVALPVVVAPARVAQRPADVKQQRRRGRRQLIVQSLRVDEHRWKELGSSWIAPLAGGFADCPARFARGSTGVARPTRRRQQGREIGLVETAGRRPGERRGGDPLRHPRIDRCVKAVQAGKQHDLAVEEVRLHRPAAGQALPG